MFEDRRFWAKVNPEDAWGCWPWRRSTRGGYGQYWDGTTVVAAHRRAWEESEGPIPRGAKVTHTCRNRACVNPAHLSLVLHEEASSAGTDNPNAKLNWTFVRRIREMHARGRMAIRDLAQDFKVSPTTIWLVVHHRTWRD